MLSYRSRFARSSCYLCCNVVNLAPRRTRRKERGRTRGHSEPYAPKCVEVEFSELRRDGVPRSTPPLAPAKQQPDLRVVSTINYNARMRSKRAGQVTEESRAAESAILPSLTNTLSDVARKERLYLLGTSAIGITTIVFTGLILLRRASSQRKHERSAKRSKTTGEDSMLGWGKKNKPKKNKRNVPDVEIHVPELDIDRLEITLENLNAHVDVDATIGRPGNEFLNISIGINARIDSAHIELEDVEAEAHVIAYLDDVRIIAVRALEVLDHHPEILTGLVDLPVPDPEPVGAKGLQEPAKRDKEDKSVHQALDRGRAMLQR